MGKEFSALFGWKVEEIRRFLPNLDFGMTERLYEF